MTKIKMAKSKLTEAQVAEIKEMYANGGVTHGELAETYGVGVATIRRMLAGVKGKDDVVAISTSKTVTKKLAVEESIEAMRQKLAEMEAHAQDILNERYIELGKWAYDVIGDADTSDYKIVKRTGSPTITTDDNVGQGLTYTGDKPYNDENSDGNDNEDEDESTDSVNEYNKSDAETDNENTFTDDEVTNNNEDDNNTTGELDVEKWLN